ncbi:hypothetical protein F5Y03DRAFT_392222 [Xylaria venustula]|nr:hypothetical protein F5Y03DRAFT_392222 [Xylaria venustula]
MAEDLRVKLGKSQMNSRNQGDPHVPWKPEAWDTAIRAWNAGIRTPEPRFPVVIRNDSPVDSPEKLQKLAGLATVPAIFNTKIVDLLTGTVGTDVRVADITWEELEILRERTESETICVLFPSGRTKKLVHRDAWIVKSVKRRSASPSNTSRR